MDCRRQLCSLRLAETAEKVAVSLGLVIVDGVCQAGHCRA
jgi:hypothetical protein